MSPRRRKKIANEKVFKTISLLSKHMLQCTNNFGKDNVNTPFSVFSYKLCSKSWEKRTLFLFFLMLIFCGHSKLVFNIGFWSEKNPWEMSWQRSAINDWTLNNNNITSSQSSKRLKLNARNTYIYFNKCTNIVLSMTL